ncbi:MAG: peptidoglycan editing factor PgeF [Betaproteobacteria bacterium HGW-Betaproteobacteria-2]|nr:MAG: peptidoglycan editing factor PgeF [Betaproteobacteria bacterium HGW-Betaproteobacteria-2]
MLSEAELIIPRWPAPANVRAIQTTRAGGVSVAPYDTLNLGMHVEDNPLNVARNRQLLNVYVPTEPVWLNQVHGVTVIDADATSCVPDADAAFSKSKGAVCAVMTADCLPLLFCNHEGTVVAATHAGWRGLCDGVIEATIDAMQVPPDSLMAWLGPAIGPQAFEVGEEVRREFMTHQSEAKDVFVPAGDGKWLGNMYRLAQLRLGRKGVTEIYGGGIDQDFCTYTDASRFFSFRRDGKTGRMASLIWLE